MPTRTGKLPTIDTKRADKLVMALMAVPGKSGQEAAVASIIERELLKAGAKRSWIFRDDAHRKSPFLDRGGQCGNLILKLPGTIEGPRRVLMAHMDTVPLCVGSKPVRKGTAVRSADRNTALGADDRAGCCTILTAALEILRRKLPHPPVTFFWAIQEEIGMNGVRYGAISKLGNPMRAFNWDGGACNQLRLGATGSYSLEIGIKGLASHAGAHPQRGVSAVAIAGIAIADLQRNGWHGLVAKGGKRGTSNIGILSAGDATNVVADRVVIHAEARSHDPAFRKRIVAEYKKAFARAVKRVKNDQGKRGKLSFKALHKYESFRMSERDPSVREAMAVMHALKVVPELGIANGGLDANWMTARGIPTVTVGCGQRKPHTVEERLEMLEYLTACRIALNLALGNGA
ncbi:MAG: M20/M25/M40 family metallo-hydrolase [Planctomycetes bacterium]|nr:M20/M25/M40 family metallo-hydrolase [Planctomycetota bacterium]